MQKMAKNALFRNIQPTENANTGKTPKPGRKHWVFFNSLEIASPENARKTPEYKTFSLRLAVWRTLESMRFPEKCKKLKQEKNAYAYAGITAVNVPTHESKWDDNSVWDKGVGEEVLQWSIDCIQVRLV